jgi:hypothetical protein
MARGFSTRAIATFSLDSLLAKVSRLSALPRRSPAQRDEGGLNVGRFLLQ